MPRNTLSNCPRIYYPQDKLDRATTQIQNVLHTKCENDLLHGSKKHKCIRTALTA